MTTARDIITEALRECGGVGLGQTPTAEDTNKAFTRLNYMMSQWALKRFMVYELVQLSKVSTGAQSYTLGPGGDFDTGVGVQRPGYLADAFQRQINVSQAVDFPLVVMRAREDYDKIALKTQSSFATMVFMDTGFPLATVYFWPIPQASVYQLFVTYAKRLSRFATLDTIFSLPEEYEPAIMYSLAERCASMYSLPVAPELAAAASEARSVIRMANTQIPVMAIPRDLSGTVDDKYNIYGDYSY